MEAQNKLRTTTESPVTPVTNLLDQLRQAWHRADREERAAIKITVDALKRDTPSERDTVARRIQAHLKI